MSILLPFPATFYRDRIIVYAPASGVDADLDPGLTPGVAGPEIPCSVDEASSSGQATTYQPGIAPFGLTKYEIPFQVNPGITQANQELHWVKDNRGVKSPAVVLLSAGPARQPGGISSPAWFCSATLRA